MDPGPQEALMKDRTLILGLALSKKNPGDIMVEIRAETSDLPILQKIDVVDFNSVSDNFKKVALRNIEVIYEQ